VARALIVGSGCWGRALGGELEARGWQVRGTSRSPQGLAAIEDAGHEAAVADPDSPGTVLDLVGDAAVVVWLLGSASGEDELLEAIHGPRLERLLEKLVDTPVRGFAYQAQGSVPDDLLAAGVGIIERAAAAWRIPVVTLGEAQGPAWGAQAADKVESLLNR
jgi:uncharacterized protein YbjT (DUF2867 family)